MNYWKHSLLSKHKFGGLADDYLAIHKFMDSSKLFYFHAKHRVLLHNTYGIDLCMEKFGDKLTNSNGKIVLVRDITAEHCKEDLLGVVPTLNNWFQYIDPSISDLIKPVYPNDAKLKEFIHRPLLMSGIPATLLITHSNFGIHLTREILGVDYALELAQHLSPIGANEWLQLVKLKEKWQFTPDLKQLKQIEHEYIQNADK